MISTRPSAISGTSLSKSLLTRPGCERDTTICVPFVPFLFEGERAHEKDNALKNAANRLKGESIPIFEGSKQRNRLKKILNVKH